MSDKSGGVFNEGYWMDGPGASPDPLTRGAYDLCRRAQEAALTVTSALALTLGFAAA